MVGRFQCLHGRLLCFFRRLGERSQFYLIEYFQDCIQYIVAQ